MFGQIINAKAGFYYIKTRDGHIFQTRAQGHFRLKNISPLVGDWVKFTSENEHEGIITAIEPRKNMLNRPQVANVDAALLVASVVQPKISAKLFDRFLAYLEFQGLEPILYFSKMDLLAPKEEEKTARFMQIYENIGYSIWDNLSLSDQWDAFLASLKGKTVVTVGQSGAGKSTLLNELLDEEVIETQPISKALGRGRHTTRDVSLYDKAGVSFVDTPGFSSLTFQDILPQALGACFVEFRSYQEACQFRTCTHTHEPRCAVKAAVEAGQIAKSRYGSYLNLYEEIKEQKKSY